MTDFRCAIQVAQDCSSGSSSALGELLESCRQYLLLIANRELEPELRAKTGASDLVQDTLLAAGNHFSGFAGSTERELLAWVRRILLFQMSTLRRRYCVAEKRRIDRERSLDDDNYIPIDDNLIDDHSPVTEAQLQEEARILETALSRLPDRFRQVIQWRHRDYRSFDEIAEELDMTAAAARQLRARAIERLQRELATAGQHVYGNR